MQIGLMIDAGRSLAEARGIPRGVDAHEARERSRCTPKSSRPRRRELVSLVFLRSRRLQERGQRHVRAPATATSMLCHVAEPPEQAGDGTHCRRCLGCLVRAIRGGE